jgi:acyl carrier protein
VDVAALLRLTPDERAGRLMSMLRSTIAGALRLQADKLDVDESVMDLGMDSLAGMQVKTSIESALHVEIPVGAFLEGLSTRQLAARLAAAVESGPASQVAASTASQGAPAAIDARAASALVDSVETMSDAEVDRLLAQIQREERTP